MKIKEEKKEEKKLKEHSHQLAHWHRSDDFAGHVAG